MSNLHQRHRILVALLSGLVVATVTPAQADQRPNVSCIQHGHEALAHPSVSDRTLERGTPAMEVSFPATLISVVCLNDDSKEVVFRHEIDVPEYRQVFDLVKDGKTDDDGLLAIEVAPVLRQREENLVKLQAGFAFSCVVFVSVHQPPLPSTPAVGYPLVCDISAAAMMVGCVNIFWGELCFWGGAAGNYGIGMATGGRNVYGMAVHTSTNGSAGSPLNCTHQDVNGSPNNCGDFVVDGGADWTPSRPYCRKASAFGADSPVVLGVIVPIPATTSFSVEPCIV